MKIVVSGQTFEAVPFKCYADPIERSPAVPLYTGYLRTDAEGNVYVFKVEPRMSQKERLAVISRYQNYLFTKKAGRPR